MKLRRSAMAAPLVVGSLALALGVSATGAAALPVTDEQPGEGFADASGEEAPEGWSVDNENVDGMREGWKGWSFHDAADIAETWGSSEGRDGFSRGDGKVAVLHSDQNTPEQGRFGSVLWSPVEQVGTEGDTGERVVDVSFDSHYRQGRGAQQAALVARIDGGDPVEIREFTADALDQAVTETVEVPAGAHTVQVGWSYTQSYNNWYWMIDDVVITDSAASPEDPEQPSTETTEAVLGFDGFEESADWENTGGWQFLTIGEAVGDGTPDRRQAFTRASGRIAVAESGESAFEGALTSREFSVTPGEPLEVRVDSHYRKRGGEQSGTATAVFDTGEEVGLTELRDNDQESAQLRLPLNAPSNAKSVRIRFDYSGVKGSGSWMLDDLKIVRPLTVLAEDATPTSSVDIFSDIQGANERMRDEVLPGLSKLGTKSDALVVNGDLVSQGTSKLYDEFFSAFQKGGGENYDTNIFTVGNHEYYGKGSTSQQFQDRFLDRTGMREVGDQGGLWGEVVVGDELPVIWVGSESYDYSKKNGAGPFVDFSDEQFEWLEGRLDHWRSEGKPVLLFSHHLLPYSVSGSYARFYQNDYAADQDRFAELIDANPNVVMFNGHTHWSVELNDWAVEIHGDPSMQSGPTAINTGAVTHTYGPKGDTEEQQIEPDRPVALRAELYDDRVRVTAYAFSDGKTEEVKHIDIARPSRQ